MFSDFGNAMIYARNGEIDTLVSALGNGTDRAQVDPLLDSLLGNFLLLQRAIRQAGGSANRSAAWCAFL